MIGTVRIRRERPFAGAGGQSRPPPLAPRFLARLVAIVVISLGLVPALGLVPVGLPGAAQPAAAAGGLTTTADAHYVVDPAKHRVHVSVTLAATNHLTDTKTRRYFFDRSYLAVPPGTNGFHVTSPGAAPKVAVAAKRKTYNLLRLDFGKQLAAGASRTFTITFDIPDPGGAPTRATRIGTSLVSFSAWGLGSDGATGGSVTVVFPPGFAVDVEAPGLQGPSTDGAGNIVFRTGRLANPLTFQATFAADRPSAFTETNLSVTVGAETIPVTIRAWPDDPAWAKRVSGLLARGLPALADAIGLPWTGERRLIVQEAVSRNASGFAGRYSPPEGTIEIAYYADSFVILHEAAHAWFDGRLLADRWATEGFASWYAIQAAKAIGEKKVVGDVLTPALDNIRTPLNAWGPPAADGSSTDVDDAEYAAALKLVSLAADRAGPDGLQAVWRAIHERRAAYQPVGAGVDLEKSDSAPDWRGLLDLFQERAGVDVTDLWSQWVIRPGDATLLDQRTAARARYDGLLARAGEWRLPRVVRDALRVWQFDQATELIASAERALDDRDAVAAAASEAGLTPPSTMRTDFEGPRGFAAASADAEAQLSTIAAYREAAAARRPQPEILERVGLWNADPDAILAGAAASFTTGDLRATMAESSYAKAIWSTAAEIGRNRIAAVAALTAAVLLGSWLATRWYRDRVTRRRHRHMARRV
jgi:hypothetical protein